MGYIGNKMSVRAYEAYESGEMPLSKWSKVAYKYIKILKGGNNNG